MPAEMAAEMPKKKNLQVGTSANRTVLGEFVQICSDTLNCTSSAVHALRDQGPQRIGAQLSGLLNQPVRATALQAQHSSACQCVCFQH